MPFRDLDLVPDALLIHDGGHWRYANPAALQLLGAANPADLVGRPILEFVHPDEREVIRARAERAAGGTYNAPMDQRLLRVDGSVVEVEVAAVPFPLDGSRGVLVIMRDVTARHEAEQRFRATFEQAAVGMAHVDLDGTWRRVNARLCAIVGYSHEELLALTFQDITHPDDLATDLGYVEQLLAGEISTYSMEKRYIRRDRSIVWINLTGSLVRKASGEPDYFIAVVEDISERKAAAAQLEASEQRFRALVEHGFDLIHIIDTSGRIVYSSGSVRHLLGRHPDELLARSAFDFIHPDDVARSYALLEELANEAGGRRTTTVRASRADGSWRLMEIAAANMIDVPAVQGIVVIARDITDRAQLEADVDRLQRVESLGRVAATITHEFNNVLMAVDTRATLLSRLKGVDERLAQITRDLKTAVERGKTITTSILRYARPAEPVREPLDVSQWLTQIGDELRELIGARHELTITAPATVGPVLADRQQLSQVITNLVLNARDAMSDGGAISIDAARTDGFVEIRVRDSGSGIPPELLQRIFDPLFTTKRAGTGLGLAVVQQIVARHRGDISVESRVGSGTTFTLRIPSAENA